jgi:hypothetical protein
MANYKTTDTLDESKVETPNGWERTRHCGYLAFAKGPYVVYASPKGHGWVRVLLFRDSNTPPSHTHFAQLAAAVAGV